MRLPPHPFRPGSQAAKLYRRLEHYPEISLSEIHGMGMDTARIREVRGFLKPHKIGIEVKRIPGRESDRLYVLTGGDNGR